MKITEMLPLGDLIGKYYDWGLSFAQFAQNFVEFARRVPCCIDPKLRITRGINFPLWKKNWSINRNFFLSVVVYFYYSKYKVIEAVQCNILTLQFFLKFMRDCNFNRRFHTTTLCFQITWATSDNGKLSTNWISMMLSWMSGATSWPLYSCAAYLCRNAALEVASCVLVAVSASVRSDYRQKLYFCTFTLQLSWPINVTR